MHGSTQFITSLTVQPRFVHVQRHSKSDSERRKHSSMERLKKSQLLAEIGTAMKLKYKANAARQHLQREKCLWAAQN